MTLLMFDSDTPNDDGILFGQILLGELDEGFGATSSPASPWSAADYRSHWKDALTKALSGHSTALVSDWNPKTDPAAASGQMWALYWQDADTLAIQEQVLLNRLAFSDPSKPSIATIQLGKHITHNDDGDAYSQWLVTKDELAALIDSLD